MLIKSKFPVWDTKKGGFSALMLFGKETSKEAYSLATLLITKGCDVNMISENGRTALG